MRNVVSSAGLTTLASRNYGQKLLLLIVYSFNTNHQKHSFTLSITHPNYHLSSYAVSHTTEQYHNNTLGTCCRPAMSVQPTTEAGRHMAVVHDKQCMAGMRAQRHLLRLMIALHENLHNGMARARAVIGQMCATRMQRKQKSAIAAQARFDANAARIQTLIWECEYGIWLTSNTDYPTV